MDNQTNSLQLVSFDEEPTCDNLEKYLTDLGYAVHFKPVRAWLTSNDLGSNFATLLLLAGNTLRGPVLSKLQEPLRLPCVGIFPSNEHNWDTELLQSCDDFVSWPCHRNEIAMRLDRLRLAGRVNTLQVNDTAALEELVHLNIVGSSPPFVHIINQIKKIARCQVPVLIEGETGTGKEMAARAIHYLSERRDHPFIPVNCGAIPDSLLENELFGHKQGAFTDAKSSQEGLICQAEGGTLFLDEVEAFSYKGQVVLLRFLQDHQYRSLGCNRHKQANIRIIAASNAKLRELVKQGEFRMDLYYRLYIMVIEMPPLSQRGNDILELANYFLNKFRIQYNQPEKQLDQDSRRWMMQHSWPGNVRELENLLHRAFLLAEGQNIKIGGEPNAQIDRRRNIIDRRHAALLEIKFKDAKARILTQFEITYLTRLIKESNGNVTLAAKRAGKERRAFGKLLKKHGIEKPNTHKT